MLSLPRILSSLRNRIWATHFNRRHRQILRRINTPHMAAIREKYTAEGTGYVQYFNLSKTVEFALARAYRLELHHRRALRILDLGCGFGVFGLIARELGHRYDGLDIWVPESSDSRLFHEVFSTLHPTPRTDGAIQRFEPIPAPVGKRYDLITAFQIAFHRFNQPDPWGGTGMALFSL